MVSTAMEQLVFKSRRDAAGGSRTKDKVLETVDAHYRGLLIKVVPEIPSWTVSEVYELRQDCQLPCQKWSGRAEQMFELLSFK